MTSQTTVPNRDDALRALVGDPDVRVLRRVLPLEDFPVNDIVARPVRLVGIVDTETTGTDPMTDELIDVAMVMIEVDAVGEIVDILSRGEALRDPGFALPEAITRLTGLTDDDLRGQAIDLDRLERRLLQADVLIAHNCAFDIAFLEGLMPRLCGAAWACSAMEVDWLGAGFDGRKLGHLLMQMHWFNAGHRAMADVISLLHVLANRLPDGRTIIGILLDRASRPTVRIEATGAGFGTRSALKRRGYRWDPRARVWWIEVEAHEETSETLWLQREIMPNGPAPHTRTVIWRERHR